MLVLKNSGMTRKASELGVEEPLLPRRRRLPVRYDETASNTYYSETAEELYRKYYFEILDTLTGEIERRFESQTFDLYCKIEDLRKACTGKKIPPIHDIVKHFSNA